MEAIGNIRGPGAMIAFELVKDCATKEPDAALAASIVTEAGRRGLNSPYYGTRFNAVRIPPPLTTPDTILNEGVDILEASIEAAISQATDASLHRG